MKKLYTLLLACLPLISIAQSISPADLPTAGTAFFMANDSNYVSSIPAGGMGQTWNYSGLQNDYIDTTGFISAAGTPYFSAFSSSNLAGHDLADDSYQYFTSSSSGLYVDGMGSADGNFHYYPSLLFIPVPFSYGDTRSNVARLQVDTTIVDTSGTTNIRFIIRYETNFEADGTGTLTIPTGTYPNVLRIKSTQIIYDSILVDMGLGVYVPFSSSSEQTVNYRYVTSGLPNNYLLGIDADSAGTTSVSSEYFTGMFNGVTSIPDQENYSPYPNPATNAIYFKSVTGDFSVNIYDSNGRKVRSALSENQSPLNVETLSNGTYLYELNMNGKIQKGHFIIKR